MPGSRPRATRKSRPAPKQTAAPDNGKTAPMAKMSAPDTFIPKAVEIGLWCCLIVIPLRLQFAVPTFIGNDSPFHARYASEFFSRVFARTFPTTAYSLWSRQWGDKEFLFHAYLAPFCQSEAFLMQGAKLGAALLFAAVLCSLAVILKRQLVPGALWLAALLPALSVPWDFRMLMVRSHLASILLILWILYLFEQRRLKPLLVLTFLYTWTYTAPYFALLLCGLMAFFRWAVTRRRRETSPESTLDRAQPDSPKSAAPSDRTLLLGGAAATLAGLLIHPQTPNQFLTDWLHLSLVATRAWGIAPSPVRLGSEFQSETLRQALSLHPGVLLCLALAWLLAAFFSKAIGRRTWLFLWMTLPTLALYGLSQRFIEYLAPLSVWALALVAADVRGPLLQRAAGFSRETRMLFVLTGLLGIIGLYTYTLRALDRFLAHPEFRITQEQAGKWLAAHARPGDLVVPLDWAQFPWLYYWAPRLRYPVGLEPTTMEVVYPEKLRYLEQVRLGKRDLDFNELQQVFPEARYVVVWIASRAVGARLAHKNYVPVFDGPDAVVFDVTQR